MKFAGILTIIFFGILLFLRNDRGDSEQEAQVVPSDRKVLDDSSSLRSHSAEANLSDAELWSAVEDELQAWIKKEAGQKFPEVPYRLFKLVREVGFRRGEEGMKGLQKLLNDQEARLLKDETSGSKLQGIGNVESYLLAAVFGGWAEEEPAEAIRRLVESQRNEEEGWGDLNSGVRMYFHSLIWDTIDTILRRSFLKLANEERATAERLFLEGVELLAFSPPAVAPALFPGLTPQETIEGVESLMTGWPGEMTREHIAFFFGQQIDLKVQNREDGDFLQGLVLGRSVAAYPEFVLEQIRTQTGSESDRKAAASWLVFFDSEVTGVLDVLPTEDRLRSLELLGGSAQAEFSLWAYHAAVAGSGEEPLRPEDFYTKLRAYVAAMDVETITKNKLLERLDAGAEVRRD